MPDKFFRKTLFLSLTMLRAGETVFGRQNFKAQYLVVSGDNDFINLRGEGTNQYYTNGTRKAMFYAKPEKREFLTSLLIPLTEGSDNIYGIGINQLMFTPTDISRIDITYGQRPYAGILFLNNTLISSDYSRKQKLTTETGLGVIGPASFAKETQTFIHRLINYQKPLGCDNQVKNDIIISYHVQYEKQLLNPSDKFEMIGLIGADVGTLTNSITTGLTFRAGKNNSYFSNYEKPGMELNTGDINKYKKFQFFFA